jgi:hypothetical protein
MSDYTGDYAGTPIHSNPPPQFKIMNRYPPNMSDRDVWSDLGLGPHAGSADAPREATQSSDTDSSMLCDVHPRYVPPHARAVHLEMGEQVAVPGAERKPDDMGVDNRHFQKLIVRVPYALDTATISVLRRLWPGCFFVSSGHGNHDHPISHACTQVAVRNCQRMFPPGARILDVYGSPKAAESYNWSQQKAKFPKRMDVLVDLFNDMDFIREANKWGPVFQEYPTIEEACQHLDDPPRYFTGTLDEVATSKLQQYDHFLLNHTLYYVDREQLLRNMVRGQVKKTLATVLKHDKKDGFLNGGEQRYSVRGEFVKQTNVSTNTTYFHRNITEWVFAERKSWSSVELPGKGLTWECHKQCDDNWVVEIVVTDTDRKRRGGEDLAKLWETAANTEELFDNQLPDGVVTILPVGDGQVVELNITSPPLLGHLRRRALGKKRVGAEGTRLYDDLCRTASHLVHPGSLFPDAVPLEVDPSNVIDHVVCAFVSDVRNETALGEAILYMNPLLCQHAAVSSGRTVNSLGKAIDVLRSSLPVAAKLATYSGVPALGPGLSALDKAVNRYLQ